MGSPRKTMVIIADDIYHVKPSLIIWLYKIIINIITALILMNKIDSIYNTKINWDKVAGYRHEPNPLKKPRQQF